MRHTTQQQEAIDTIDRNLQIIACAGSGKTQVVASRVIKILREHGPNGVTPENIVAFTFTDKAAAELKDRITRLYEAEFGHVQHLAGMYVGTIHGFCLEILQRYLFRYLKYDVLDEVRQRLLVDRYYRQSGMASLDLKRWIESSLYLTILRIVREAETDRGVLDGHRVQGACADYQGLLDRLRYLDYDEIVHRAVTELRDNEDLRERLRQRIKYLTVDEFQDVSPIQELLIRELQGLGANLCVVGDDDQNLYQWRGSDVRYIVEFAKRYPNVTQVPLEENFRSSPAIVEVARRAVEANIERLAKEMQSAGTHGFERGDLLAITFPNPDDEAAWIAVKIQSLRGMPYTEPDGSTRGLSWSDCAILLRSVRNSAAPIVEALRLAGIPHIVTGMTGLFNTPEVQAATGIFQFMTREITAHRLRQLWHDVELGLTEDDLGRGVTLLDDRRSFDSRKRFSAYALQRTYLDFLTAVELREERVPAGRGEVVLYNLGKFSQVITDYEGIHYKSAPEEKYPSFVQFLRHQAPYYYPEGGQDVAYAVPDAVRIMTIHQAKGMEFPVVFLPALQRNRFPAKRQHNRVWNYLPRAAVRNADRYDGSPEDERRVFYVALTRAEKHLFCSWAPDPANRLYKQPSEFFNELTRREQFLTREPPARAVESIEPAPRRPLVNVEFSFSDVKYFFECPYQFKLRLLYGFNPPIHEALGYGRSLHNALAEIHRRALQRDFLTDRDIPDLVEDHLNIRYAFPELEQALRRAAGESLGRYLREHGPYLDRLVHAEETIELTLPNGIVVRGRIDLIKRTDTNETVVVDFKSTERAQPEEVTEQQLQVYALGYEQRFGHPADLIEIHDLDAGGSVRQVVDSALTAATVAAVSDAGERLRENRLERHPNWCTACDRCDVAGICRTRPAVALPA